MKSRTIYFTMKKTEKLIATVSRGTEQALCVINGVIGDTLEESEIGLTMRMALYTPDEILCLTKKSMKKMQFPDTGKICILAHGSCGSEKGWGFKEDAAINYGSLLQKEFGHTPFYLRYNSGLHISTNGKRLSDLFEKFVRCYPKKISELVLIGHSMGGLIYRSACYYGQKEKRKWIGLIRKIFYLGSPHLGTHLEKLGKLTTTVLNKIPNPITKIIVRLSDLRSAGVKDLRHGYLTDEDWKHKQAEDLFYWPQNKTPLLKKVEHYLICGTLSKVAGSKMGYLFGDGMVHTASGTGQGMFPSSAIPFSQDHCKIIPGISHYHLLKSKRVYAQIKVWCGL